MTDETRTILRIAQMLLPIVEQVRPAIEKACDKITCGVGETPTGEGRLVENGIAVGFGASATLNGIAIGRRVHAQPGMICIDIAWLRDVVKAHSV